MKKRRYAWLMLVFGAVFIAMNASGQEKDLFSSDVLESITYREIGPAKQSGRIVDLAVPLSQPYTFYVASASGGLWKSVNNGTTFEPIFDDQSVISIGDIAVSPSDPSVVWVGTGEANNSRSSYWGDGVYKSVDGGKSWTNMGLKESHHIGRIVIHPKNPDIVYVVALGYLYSFNEERGLYKTTDGGVTWKKALYINERVGVVDVAMNFADPDILFRQRMISKDSPGTSKRVAREAQYTKVSMGERVGKSWAQTSLTEKLAASASISIKKIRILFMPQLKTPTYGRPQKRN
jgi:photosystem II stability/assembly factor-like uncharacterized protein